MLQTDAADLMDLFARLFDTDAHALARTGGGESTLRAPSPELSAPPVKLSDLLGEDGSVLSGFLEDYAARHAPDLAEEFSALARLIRDSDGTFLRRIPRRRALEFVYPVV